MAKRSKRSGAKKSSTPIKGTVGARKVRLPGRLIGLLAHCVALLHPTKGNMGELRRVKRIIRKAQAEVATRSDLLGPIQSLLMAGASVSDVKRYIEKYQQDRRVEGEDDDVAEEWTLVEDTGPGYERASWVYALDVELNPDEARVVLVGFERASKEGEKDEPDEKIAFPPNTGDDVYLLHDVLTYWKDENADAKDRPDVLAQWEHDNPVVARFAKEAHEARERLIAERDAETEPETQPGSDDATPDDSEGSADPEPEVTREPAVAG